MLSISCWWIHLSNMSHSSKVCVRLSPNQNQNYIFCIFVKQQSLVVFFVSFFGFKHVWNNQKTIACHRSRPSSPVSWLPYKTRSFISSSLALSDKRTRYILTAVQSTMAIQLLLWIPPSEDQTILSGFWMNISLQFRPTRNLWCKNNTI